MKLLCRLGFHKPEQTAGKVLLGDGHTVADAPTMRCKRCGAFTHTGIDWAMSTLAAAQGRKEP